MKRASRTLLVVLSTCLLVLYGLAGCSSDSGGGTSAKPDNGVKADTTAGTDTGPGTTDRGTTSKDTGGPEPDTAQSDPGGGADTTGADTAGTDAGGGDPGTADTGPPPVETCADGSKIDVAGIANPVQRIHRLGIGGYDPAVDMVCNADTARDVDGKPETSAPDSDPTASFVCANGLNNELMEILDTAKSLASQDLRQTMEDNVKSGQINIAFEAVGYKNDGTPFVLNFFNLKLPDSNAFDETAGTFAECDINDTAKVCDFLVTASSFDGTCDATVVSFDTATVKGGKLEITGDTFALTLPVQDTSVTLTVKDVLITADVVEDSGALTGFRNGLISGVIPADVIMTLVDNFLPPDAGIPPDLIKGIIEGFYDIDTDADGTKDALSVGIQFETTGVNVTGVDGGSSAAP